MIFDVELTYALKPAFERTVWSALDVLRLCGTDSEKLRSLLKVLKGYSVIVEREHLIDCDADPIAPDGWTLESHRKGGVFKWEESLVELYLSETQKQDGAHRGKKLEKDLAELAALNANVLDYLLGHPLLIPETWKESHV